MAKQAKLLALCDSPTCDTGFGVVAQNLLANWQRHFQRIDIFGINYWGEPHELPYRIHPASWPTRHWASKAGLQEFLGLLKAGGYTHVFLMQDTFNLSNGWFPGELQRICREKGIVSLLYYPVDAALDPQWTEIIEAVQVPVAYTQYGREETLAAMMRGGLPEERVRAVAQKIRILPHGVDRLTFKPLANRAELRAHRIQNLPGETVVMVNVNANQRRKDVMRGLEILKGLKEKGMPVFLLLHMPATYSDGDANLEIIGAQLGLRFGVDWMHTEGLFKGNLKVMPKEELNVIYNVADMMLTTTLGEGWGLSTTEALAAGLPVAIPDHTACGEMARLLAGQFAGESSAVCLLPVEKDAVVLPLDNSRARHRTHVQGAVEVIYQAWQAGVFKLERRQRLVGKAANWLSWVRIAEEWTNLFDVAPERPVEAANLAAETGIRKHYYIEIWGGLGDAFNRLAHGRAWQKLNALEPDEQVTIALFTHNPHVRELFTGHPKFSQIRLLEYGYWQTGEFEKKRKAHGLPLAGTGPMPGGPDVKMDFTGMADTGVDDLLDLLEAQFPDQALPLIMLKMVLISPTAGLKERDIPRELVETICQRLKEAGFILVQVGRNFTRFDRQEMDLGDLVHVSMVDKLTVPATARLLSLSAGIVTCHSALNLLAWHLRKPQLLVYPPEVQPHLDKKTTWGFGAGYEESVALALEFPFSHAEALDEFIGVLKGQPKKVAVKA